MACVLARRRGEVWLTKGLRAARNSVARPRRQVTGRDEGGPPVDRVIIAVDPHKLPVTIEARDSRERAYLTGYRRVLPVDRERVRLWRPVSLLRIWSAAEASQRGFFGSEPRLPAAGGLFARFSARTAGQ